MHILYIKTALNQSLFNIVGLTQLGHLSIGAPFTIIMD